MSCSLGNRGLPNVDEQPNVVITGCGGFIGAALSRSLAEAGYAVWGVDQACAPGDRRVKADLLNPDEARRALMAVPRPYVLIHAAAWAHGQRLPARQSFTNINAAITANVLAAAAESDPRLVFLSSVAVYGEDRRSAPVDVGAELRPATDYGRSKKRCEQLILESKLTQCDILRLAPVFDDGHMKDVRKRAFLPGFPRVKLQLEPPPSYSLCHIDTLTRVVLRLLGEPLGGHRILNVADRRAYDQHQLASWFPGRPIRLRVGLVRPLYWATHLLPPKLGYPLRCAYWKLMQFNVYRTIESAGDDNPVA